MDGVSATETDVMDQGVSMDPEENRAGGQALAHPDCNPHFISQKKKILVLCMPRFQEFMNNKAAEVERDCPELFSRQTALYKVIQEKQALPLQTWWVFGLSYAHLTKGWGGMKALRNLSLTVGYNEPLLPVLWWSSSLSPRKS